MPPNSISRARYERKLANAHKWLYWAQQEAEAIGDHGAAEDLKQILAHVTVLGEDSLRGQHKPSGAIEGQLRLA